MSAQDQDQVVPPSNENSDQDNELRQKWLLNDEYLFDYSSPFWKLVELLSTLGLGVWITLWWRLPTEFPQELYFSVLSVILIIVGGLNYFQHKLSTKTQVYLNSLVKSVSKNQNDLTDLLNNMPPVQAMHTFTNSYVSTVEYWRAINIEGLPTTESGFSKRIKDLSDGVLMCLDGLARLYIQYEHKPLSTACYAHWLQFWSMADLDADSDLKKLASEKLRFVDNPEDPFYDLEGVLHINPSMTVVANQKIMDHPEHDDSAVECFLPVPRKRDCDKKLNQTRFLPVAPLAFDEGTVIYSNVDTQITSETLKNRNVNQQVLTDALKYFHDEQKIGSIVGYRLLYTAQARESLPLGVIAIFTRNTHSKDGDAVVESYLTVCRPLLEMQADFVCDIILARDALIQLKQSSDESS
ncbi:hypothetical protein EHM94_18370 [Marinobacter sp. NP-6]|uniref:hypothetical protein n=1 Tax=Marinobacter sp. NP-6 TaxID=2488666 RepID=UPI000FCA7DA0|nr:hypothetical protein [Marinobacter sp. NP-6]RUT76992.1 hypothetical protein EHM94_18370 [Marinobacter sp. NP-6]